MRKRKTGQNLHLSNLNFKIIIYALILSIIGIFMVHSATQNEAVTGMITTTQKQILGMVLGLVLMMILTSSISNGIAFGFIAYAIAMTAAGKTKEVHITVWVLMVIFLIYFALPQFM